MKQRLPALDWMRGLVMVLMAVDHASAAFNGGRLLTDSPGLYQPGMALPAAQFWTRWITHLCAPTFLFLAGTALALSVERRSRLGEQGGTIDRHLLVRGVIIAVLDPLLISWLWRPGSVLLQVLYAIGVSLILMIPLRRLSTRWMVGVALGVLLLGEMITGAALAMAGGTPTVAGALVVHAGIFPRLQVAYPVLPWLAMMMLGWAFGRRLLDARLSPQPRVTPRALLWVSGLAALALFVVVRGGNSYGNMMLLRDDGSLIQWMHVSKYPPSMAFSALELGLMAVMLSLLLRVAEKWDTRVNRNGPLLVFGQTALFFYVAHILVLELAARTLGVHQALGLGATYVATAAVLIVLYPCCRAYRTYKEKHPGSLLRYI